MLPTLVAGWLAPLISFISPFYSSSSSPSTLTLTTSTASASSSLPGLQFELRHLHAVSNEARVIFSDVSQDTLKALSSSVSTSPPLSSGNTESNDNAPSAIQATYDITSTRRIKTYKPSSIDAHTRTRLRSLRFGEDQWLDWDEDEILAPDVEKRSVLLELAKMTNNAYVEPTDPAWYDLEGHWNDSYPFGWEPESDGFRGHVFATPDNSTVVVSIKGTSAGVFGNGGPTVKKDKLNDNLLFSCCCARVDWTWTTVCGCYRGGWKCEQNCLEKALAEDSLFYPIGANLYNNLTYMYPTSNIWIIGHSLGGALASLVGITFGLPVVAFEAPGERLAASRLHLPSPPSTHHVTHIYHTADPIPMGTCNGVLSSCALAGYAMETRCHLGKRIIYDTVSNASWSVDIRTHGIVNVVERLLSEPWPPSEEIGREVPVPEADVDCVECYSWDFGDYPP